MTSDFHKAKMLIKNGETNKGLLILNKINNSNINYIAKENVEFIIKFATTLDNRKYANIDYNKIINKSYLHRGFAVKWSGKTANLYVKNGHMYFSLLIDYKKKDIFKGVAEIFSDKIYPQIKNGDIITVEGIFTDSIGDKKKIHLVVNNLTLKNP